MTIAQGLTGGVNNLADHFMTFDSATPNLLRPLDYTTEYLWTENLPSPGLMDDTYTATYGVQQNLMVSYDVSRSGDVDWYATRPNLITSNIGVNSLRFGTSTPTSSANAQNTNDPGSVLVLDAGVTMFLGDSSAATNCIGTDTHGSGMILFGRDVNGVNPVRNLIIDGGALNFGSREAIIIDESGNSALFRTDIQGTGGLTKSGANTVYFDTANSYSGDTHVAEGILDLRNLDALGSSTKVITDGTGSVYLELGSIMSGTPTLWASTPSASQNLLRSNGGVNSWSGDVVIDTTDALGNWLYTSYINTGARDVLNLNGNIYSNELANPISSDIDLNDSRLISTSSQDAAGGIININGQFRDNAMGSVGAVVSSANENQLLRFQIRGSDQLVVNVRQQWDAAGRIMVEQGYLRFEGQGNFWTDGAAASLTQTNGNSGMRLSGGITSNNGTQDLAVVLANPGQVLNINRLDIGGDGTNNWNALGNITLAGTNTTGTVTFGLGNERVIYTGANTTNQYIRDLSVYAAQGGTVDLNYRLDDTSDFTHSSFTKIGSGVVNYNSRNGSEAGDLEQVNVAGGLLRLTNYANATGTRVDTGALIAFAGGAIEMNGVGSTANLTENFTGTAATNAVLGGVRNTVVAPGATDVIVTSTSGRTTTMNIGDATTGLVRASGGTVNFVENANGGTAVLTFKGSSGLVANTAIPWATYGNSYSFDAGTASYTRNALDFAMVTGAGNDVALFAGANREDQDDASLWTNGKDVSEAAAGFSGTTAAGAAINTLHFDFNGASSLAVDAGGLQITSGGVMVSSAVAAAKSISGGALTAASGADLIIHQYGSAPLTIDSVIANNGGTALVKSGTGELILTAANSYTGGTHFNDGVVSISSQAQLGAIPGVVTADDLYFNGGALHTTATMSLDATRGITIGGNGAEIRSDAGTTLTIQGVLGAAPSLLTGYSANVASGGLIKTGTGTLTLTELNHTYTGMTEIQEGRLLWEPSIIASSTGSGLGTTDAFLDGTIVRSGATLELAAKTPDVASNLSVTMYEWLTFDGGSTLATSLNNSVATPRDVTYNLRGVIQINANGNVGTPAGSLVINSGARSINLNDDGGYVTGDGGIIKIGNSTLAFREPNVEWTGQMTVAEGAVSIWTAGPALGMGTLPILLGHNVAGEAAGEPLSGNNAAAIYFRDESGFADVSHLTQDIIVRADTAPTSQTKRLGAYYLAHLDEVNFDGSITLNDDLEFYYNDDTRNSAATTSGADVRDDTRALGAPTNEERLFINFNGAISGSKTITTNVSQGGNANVANGSIVAPGDDLVLRPIFGLNGNNGSWTGSLTMGNGAADADRVHTVSLGSDQALSAANNVTMKWDSVLQTSGNDVTMGNLSTPSGINAVNYADPTTSNGYGVVVENASATPGTLTVTQTTNSTYYALFRDGEVFGADPDCVTPGALSLVKAGSARSTLATLNTYTGTTDVNAGVLQVGTGGDGTFGQTAFSADLVGRTGTGLTTVNPNGRLAGSGQVQGDLVLAGGIITPGDELTSSSGTGTLFVGTDAAGSGDFTMTSGTLVFQALTTSNFNSGISFGDPGYNYTDANYLTTVTQAVILASSATGDQLDPAGYGSDTSAIYPSNHDHLEIRDNLTWTGGTIKLDFTVGSNTYTPMAGDIFNLIDWFGTSTWNGFSAGGDLRVGGLIGNLDLPSLIGYPELRYDTRFLKSDGIIFLVAPEPSRWLLIAVGLTLLLSRRRR
ncbi:MAG: autotransporter-associated beta strand repeat-containing protein [Verrucomicrobiales bacterium]|nr:autotransporter-associated beta strand repeat-containing protein [Verrucomicrobiales bacterium]